MCKYATARYMMLYFQYIRDKKVIFIKNNITKYKPNIHLINDIGMNAQRNCRWFLKI